MLSVTEISASLIIIRIIIRLMTVLRRRRSVRFIPA